MLLQLAHTKTDVFQQSDGLALECYRVSKMFPAKEKFTMVQQVGRAALSVHLNIAEGCSRKSFAERKRFFEISGGSVIEIVEAIGIAYGLENCDMKMIENSGSLIIRCFKQLTGMIKSSERQ